MVNRGRQPLPIGAHGKITTKQLGPKLWESHTRVKDPDGHLREVERRGKSKTAAENNLKIALAKRPRNSEATVTGSTRIREVGELWLAQFAKRVEAGDRAPRSLQDYLSTWQLHVKPALGELRVSEANTGVCERWLVALRERKGAATCSRARTVLSGVMGYAARMDAIDVNPVPALSPIPGAGQRARKPRAMTADEQSAWLAWMDTHVADKPDAPGETPRRRLKRSPEREREVAASRALGDITRLMLATGVRIGEAMALSWDDVDLVAGTVAIRWHIVRLTGKGLVRQPGAKSEAGDRLLRIPSWCVDMLRRRAADPLAGYPVFADSLGGWRDPNLVSRWWRWSRDEAGFGWVTSRVFRQTVITVLDEAGLPTREVADQVGHSRIGQTQDYMARKIASERAASVLESMF